LAVVKDLCTQRIVGWSMSRYIDVALVRRALTMAFRLQQPKAGLIFHSDRGSQYASRAITAMLLSEGAYQSMSRKSNCWDNAPAKSFFARFKQECLNNKTFSCHAELETEVNRYIAEFYNTERLHSSLGYLSPLQYEEQLRAKDLAA
jgi:transposase InsO family protein